MTATTTATPRDHDRDPYGCGGPAINASATRSRC